MSREYEAMEVEKWVNLEDIADHLSVSTDTVRNWRKQLRKTRRESLMALTVIF